MLRKFNIFIIAVLCLNLVWYCIRAHYANKAENANTASEHGSPAEVPKKDTPSQGSSALSLDNTPSVPTRSGNSALSGTEEYKGKVEEAARRKNPIFELDGAYSEFERKLAQVLRDCQNKGLVRNNKWRRILKGNVEDAERLKQLMSEYLELIRKSKAAETVVPGQLYWGMFFDENTFDLTDEEIQLLPAHDVFAEQAFSYLEKVDPIWCVESGKYTRTDSKKYGGDPSKLPERYQSIYSKAQKTGKEMMSPCAPLAFILMDFHNCKRADRFTDGVLGALQECGFDVKGKVLADVGAGTGMALLNFRDAVGKGPAMYAAELDPYMVDLLQFTGIGANALALECNIDNCCLKPNSVDIITLINVHMGAGLGEHYKCCTSPWLKSMREALRPGGVLVISEGNMELFDKGLIAMVEANGFKLRKFFPPLYNGANTSTGERLEAIAVFDK